MRGEYLIESFNNQTGVRKNNTNLQLILSLARFWKPHMCLRKQLYQTHWISKRPWPGWPNFGLLCTFPLHPIWIAELNKKPMFQGILHLFLEAYRSYTCSIHICAYIYICTLWKSLAYPKFILQCCLKTKPNKLGQSRILRRETPKSPNMKPARLT